jgi:hypothetical protein
VFTKKEQQIMSSVVEETKMSEQDFAEGLKIFPCPKCEAIGHLHLVKDFKIVATRQDKKIEAVGEATVCGECEHVFMSDDLTEIVANQIERVFNGNTNKYMAVDKSNGQMIEHSIN